MGYYDGARRPPGQQRDQRRDQQRLHLQSDGRRRPGKVDCGNWAPTYTIPGSAFPASRHLPGQADRLDRRADPGRLHGPRRQTRDAVEAPLRPADATYQAYNTFGGKSLYYGDRRRQHRLRHRPRGQGLLQPAPRPGRRASTNWFLGPDFELLSWLEKQGYDVSYTDDVPVAGQPGTAARPRHDRRLRPLRVLVAASSSTAFKAARDAGVNIASFSANTAYWKVRYEDGNRTLVCYKTVQGGGSTGNGADQRQRLGPRRHQGHRRRRPRPRRHSRHRRRQPAELDHDLPRQRRARPATPARRPAAGSAPTCPRTSCSGCMYVGDNDAHALPADGPGRQRQRRVRRRPDLAQHRHLREHARPTSAQTRRLGVGRGPDPGPVPRRASPPGSSADRAPTSRPATDNSWIQDEGRLRNTDPAARPARHRRARSSTRPPAAPRSSPAARCSGRDGLSGRSRRPRSSRRPTTSSPTWASSPNTPEGITLDPGGSNRAPNAQLHDLAEPDQNQHHGHLQRLRLDRPRRHDRQIRMGPRRQRQLRDQHRHQPERHPQLLRPRANSTSACASPTTAAPPTSRCGR